MASFILPVPGSFLPAVKSALNICRRDDFPPETLDSWGKNDFEPVIDSGRC